MIEGTALLGVCVLMVLLIRWLLAHDRAPSGKCDGLFALREPDKNQIQKKNQ
jgi:hypothetical protein